MLSTGSSMAFMVAFVNMGTLALQTSINTFDNNIIVAHTGARKATSIFMLPFGVMGNTLATYCGQNLGAGKYERIKKGIFQTLLLTFVWCFGVALTAFLAGGQIVHLITASTEKEVLFKAFIVTSPILYSFFTLSNSIYDIFSSLNINSIFFYFTTKS